MLLLIAFLVITILVFAIAVSVDVNKDRRSFKRHLDHEVFKAIARARTRKV